MIAQSERLIQTKSKSTQLIASTVQLATTATQLESAMLRYFHVRWANTALRAPSSHLIARLDTTPTSPVFIRSMTVRFVPLELSALKVQLTQPSVKMDITAR
jgi:hypothetical protein